MIVLLTGDDQHAIREKLHQYKAEIDSRWLDLCYHRFPSYALDQAISAARTPSLTGGKKLVIVEDCNFKQWGEAEEDSLQQLSQVPEFTILVFVATSLDKRFKIYKHLIKYAMVFEFTLIPPWRNDLIRDAIATQAKTIKLPISTNAVEYLAEAIGNDMTRAASELSKLSVYSSGKSLAIAEVKELVPCQTQNNLQLAAAIRQGESDRVLQLLNNLLSRSEPLMVIVATLLTQFRTWLWVKCAINSGMKKDSDIARLCNIGNPNRIYYLRQEVATTSIKALARAVIMLLHSEISVKKSAGNQELMPMILNITQLFKSTKTEQG